MSYPDSVHAHALYMRTRAAALRDGDAEAREHAQRLREQADAIETQPKNEERK